MATPPEELMEVAHFCHWDDARTDEIIESAGKICQLPVLATTEKEIMARVQEEVKAHEQLLVSQQKKEKKSVSSISVELDD